MADRRAVNIGIVAFVAWVAGGCKGPNPLTTPTPSASPSGSGTPTSSPSGTGTPTPGTTGPRQWNEPSYLAAMSNLQDPRYRSQFNQPNRPEVAPDRVSVILNSNNEHNGSHLEWAGQGTDGINIPDGASSITITQSAFITQPGKLFVMARTDGTGGTDNPANGVSNNNSLLGVVQAGDVFAGAVSHDDVPNPERTSYTAALMGESPRRYFQRKPFGIQAGERVTFKLTFNNTGAIIEVKNDSTGAKIVTQVPPASANTKSVYLVFGARDGAIVKFEPPKVTENPFGITQAARDAGITLAAALPPATNDSLPTPV